MEVFAVTEATPKIFLGKQGENNAVPILFKVNTWINKYGEGGTFTLSHKRATDSVPYPATITLTDDGVLWLITAADNAVEGYGECELKYTVGDVIKKPSLGKPTPVKRSLPSETRRLIRSRAGMRTSSPPVTEQRDLRPPQKPTPRRRRRRLRVRQQEKSTQRLLHNDNCGAMR